MVDRLIGIDDPIRVLEVALDLLTGSRAALAATLQPELPIVMRVGREDARQLHLPALPDARMVAQLLHGPVTIVDLVDRDIRIGFLAVTDANRADVEAVSYLAAKALGHALRLRDERAIAVSLSIESERVPCAFVDAEGRVRRINAPFAELFPDASAGVPFGDLRAIDVSAVHAVLQQVLSGGSAISFVDFATRGPLLRQRCWSVCIHALERDGGRVGATLAFDERTERAHEDARLKMVAEASVALRAPSPKSVLPSTLVPGLGDWAVLHLLDEQGVLRFASSAHRDASRARFTRDIPSGFELHGRRRGGEAAVKTFVPGQISRDEIDALIIAQPELASTFRSVGEGNITVVPITSEAGPIGSMTIGRSGAPHDSSELRAIREIVQAGSHAIRQARTAEIERRNEELFYDFRGMSVRVLRDPLAAMGSHLYSAQAAAAAGEDLTTHLESLSLQVERMRRALVELEAAALPESHRASPPACQAAELVKEVLVEQAHALLGRTLSTNIDPVTVRADRARLRSAFGAIVSHAADKAGEGGLVCVRVAREGRDALFSVSDTGAGFGAAPSRRAFDGLWLGDAEASKLTMARATIESLSGRTWIETGEGTGAAYCFVLPLA